MQEKSPFFTLGVAYYPDYIASAQLTRLPSGDIKALSREDRIRCDFMRMQKDGIKGIRIGEFSWSHVEPSPGEFHTATFTLALDLAAEFGLSVMMCTPTATPPKWLIDQMPEILPINRHGYTIPWGGRRHYDPVNPRYREQSRRITEVYAKAFGSHPAVTSWQTDNELANHGSWAIFTPAVRDAFRLWLAQRFQGDIALLNEHWFTCFWSQHYRSFAEIELPKDTWTEANPHLELAYRRFMSEAYRDFQRDQVSILRHLSPGREITHNITPMMFDICLWQLSADLDFAGYDHYQMEATPNPLSSASQYNLMRSLKGGRKFVVLEQQPVQVNWQQVNGRWGIDWLYLWGLQAAFLGASAMYYFSWQRFPGGTEQYHDAVLPHDLRQPVSRQEKILHAKTHTFEALAQRFLLTALPSPTTDVLIVHNMESLWAHDICSQTTLWNGVKLIEELQRPFLQHGLGVDMVPSIAAVGAKLVHYKLLVLPGYAFELSDSERAQLKAFIAGGGSVWSLPRTAVKDSAGRMVPFPLQLFARDDFYFDDGGGLLAAEREVVQIQADGSYLEGQIWADKIVISNGERWQQTATFVGGLYAEAPAILQTRAATGAGRYVHFAFYPVMTQALSNYLIALFELKPRLSAAFNASVQTYSFAVGARRFVAAINFGFREETLDLPTASKTSQGYRAYLSSDLKPVATQEQPHHAGCLSLEPRSFGFWELAV